MKKRILIFCGLFVTGMFIGTIPLFPQDDTGSPLTTGADFVSSYIWRGSELGKGPAFQPVIEYNKRLFTAGAWGSFDFNNYQEIDLYFSFSLPSGFNIGITDYYSPDLRYFDYTRASGSHAFEINLGYSWHNLGLEANYVINKAGGVGSAGQDLYFQAGYSFGFLTFFAGAGNGWHNYDPENFRSRFEICNTGIAVTRDIKITESFIIPVKGELVLNPAQERMFLVVGFTL